MYEHIQLTKAYKISGDLNIMVLKKIILHQEFVQQKICNDNIYISKIIFRVLTFMG
jgi:hypothetical protein